MLYTDNPRRIYGKVTITYSDSEISKEIEIFSSGDAEISAKEQVYEGHTEPDLKACTMDGNCTMGGQHQMISTGFVTGWWSSNTADENGNFTEPYPYLELTFTPRPVFRWTVTGDCKLNQYPIDFDLVIFSQGTELNRIVITENTDVIRMVFPPTIVTGVDRIRIEIKKWNKPFACVKLLQFFDIMEETYGGADIKDFEVLEQIHSGDAVSFNISSNSATVSLINKDRKFDRGYLKDLVLLNRKVEPYIGIESVAGLTWTSLGVFYSDEWNIPQSGNILKLRCADRLMRLQNITYVGFPYTDYVTIYDIAEDILLKAGLIENEYEIDAALREIVLSGAFLQKKFAWNALQDVAKASLSYVYADRENRIRISKDKKVTASSKAALHPSNSFQQEQKTALNDFSNRIEVEYSDIQLTGDYATVFENTVSISPNGKVTMQADYSADIREAVFNLMPSVGIEIIYFESGVNAGKFELKNTTSNYINTTVSITGYVIKTNSQTVIIEDVESIQKFGIHQFYYSGSKLIQSYDRASEIGGVILYKLSQKSGETRAVWRGDPSLLPADVFTLQDRFGESKEYYCEYNRFTFDGGLREETKGRKIGGEN